MRTGTFHPLRALPFIWHACHLFGKFLGDLCNIFVYLSGAGSPADCAEEGARELSPLFTDYRHVLPEASHWCQRWVECIFNTLTITVSSSSRIELEVGLSLTKGFNKICHLWYYLFLSRPHLPVFSKGIFISALTCIAVFSVVFITHVQCAQGWRLRWSWRWCRRTWPTWRSWTLSAARSSSCRNSVMWAGTLSFSTNQIEFFSLDFIGRIFLVDFHSTPV